MEVTLLAVDDPENLRGAFDDPLSRPAGNDSSADVRPEDKAWICARGTVGLKALPRSAALTGEDCLATFELLSVFVLDSEDESESDDVYSEEVDEELEEVLEEELEEELDG